MMMMLVLVPALRRSTFCTTFFRLLFVFPSPHPPRPGGTLNKYNTTLAPLSFTSLEKIIGSSSSPSKWSLSSWLHERQPRARVEQPSNQTPLAPLPGPASAPDHTPLAPLPADTASAPAAAASDPPLSSFQSLIL